MIYPFIVIEKVEQYYHLIENIILSHCRTKMVVEARAVAMYLIKKLTRYSFTEIAVIFNKADHSNGNT